MTSERDSSMIHTMRLAIIAMVLAGMAAGCNPYRKINMKNRSGGDVEFTWKLIEQDSLQKSPFFMSNSTTTKFDLKPEKPYNTVEMTFGMGSWRKDVLDQLTARLECLEIKSGNGTIQLKSSKEIYTFLYNRRTGIGKRKIDILITK